MGGMYGAAECYVSQPKVIRRKLIFVERTNIPLVAYVRPVTKSTDVRGQTDLDVAQ